MERTRYSGTIPFHSATHRRVFMKLSPLRTGKLPTFISRGAIMIGASAMTQSMFYSHCVRATGRAPYYFHRRVDLRSFVYRQI